MFITESGFGMVIHGIILAMEEERAKGADISDDAFVSIKSALMGPLAGFGDTIMDATIRTLNIAIFQPLAMQGMLIAPIISGLIQICGKPLAGAIMLPLGYKMGTDAVDKLLDNGGFKKLMSAASILSMFIMGSMSYSYVSLKSTLTIGSVELQNILDSILPGMLPLALVLGIYYLMTKKNVSATWIILSIMVIGILGSLTGIL